MSLHIIFPKSLFPWYLPGIIGMVGLAGASVRIHLCEDSIHLVLGTHRHVPWPEPSGWQISFIPHWGVEKSWVDGLHGLNAEKWTCKLVCYFKYTRCTNESVSFWKKWNWKETKSHELFDNLSCNSVRKIRSPLKEHSLESKPVPLYNIVTLKSKVTSNHNHFSLIDNVLKLG